MENHQKPMDIDSDMFDASQKLFLLDLAEEPDIIINIFTYLGLNDRLAFASTCKQLNNLHNCRSDLVGQIWLISNAAASCKFPLSRQYSNVKLLDFDFKLTNRPSPADLLKPYAVKLAGLQVVRRAKDENDDSDDSSENPVKLLELIPFFSHLTYLDLLSGKQIKYFNRVPEFGHNVQPATKIITMPCLQHLKIGFELFASLHREFIDFSQCRKLVSLDIERQASSWVSFIVRHDRMQATLELIPILIQQTQRMRSLKIIFGHCVRLFDHQLSLAPGAHQLEKFKFVDYASTGATRVQQMNLLDFMETHVQEGKAKFHVGGDGFVPAKVEPSLCQFIAKNLDMPHETQGIFCARLGRAGNMLFDSKYYRFSGNELRRVFQSPINLNPATINFYLYLDEQYRRPRNFILSAVCFKYQNLQHLAITLVGLSPKPNLEPLNTLVHLKSLDLKLLFSHRFNMCLHDVSIAGLEKFKFDIYMEENMKHRYFVQLLNFIDRHNRLTSFDIGMWANKPYLGPRSSFDNNEHVSKKFYDDCFDLLNCAMKNLAELQLLTYRSDHDLKEKVPDRFRATTHKLLEDYTKTGFTFECVKYEDYEMTFTKTAEGVDEKFLLIPS